MAGCDQRSAISDQLSARREGCPRRAVGMAAGIVQHEATEITENALSVASVSSLFRLRLVLKPWCRLMPDAVAVDCQHGSIGTQRPGAQVDGAGFLVGTLPGLGDPDSRHVTPRHPVPCRSERLLLALALLSWRGSPDARPRRLYPRVRPLPVPRCVRC
jgi:hypothetical protein